MRGKDDEKERREPAAGSASMGGGGIDDIDQAPLEIKALRLLFFQLE